MKKIELTQGTPEWLAYRKSRVGASDIGNIAGCAGAFRTRAQVLEEKLGAAKVENNSYLDALFKDGHEWEALVRAKLNDAGHHHFEPVVVEHPEHPGFFASLDGIDENTRTILEVKSTKSIDRFHEIVDAPPENYIAQIQWQLFVTDYETALLAVVHESGLVIQTIERDDAMIDRLVLAANSFLAEMATAQMTGVVPHFLPAVPEVQELLLLKAMAEKASAKLDEVNEKIKAIGDKLLTEYSASRLENEKVVITRVERAGAIDYKKVPELKGVDLEPYRKKPSSFVKVTLRGEGDDTRRLERD